MKCRFSCIILQAIKKMNENKEILILLEDNLKMVLTSTKEILSCLLKTDNKIKSLVEEEHKTYEKFYKELKLLLKKYKVKINKKGLLKYLTSTIAIRTEINKDNSDSSISNILIRGFTIGSINLEAKLKSYKTEINKEILKLAKNILSFSQNQINLLKEHL